MIAICRLVMVAVGLVLAAPAGAQLPLGPSTKRFADIAQLAQEGYGDSARASIGRILTAMPRTDPAYPEALYTAGIVARTGDSMRNVFSRLVVNYATTPWADRSLLRLIQIDYGLGKMELVTNETNRFFGDFPDSPFLPTAAKWGALAAFSQQKMQQGCDWLTRGIAKVGDDLELKNQLLFAKQNCNLGPGVQFAPKNEDSLRAPPPRPAPDTAKPPTKAPVKAPTKAPITNVASPWRVQVAAIRDKAVIQSVIRKTRVQAGPFATRAAALAAVSKVKTAAGGSPIVVPAP